MDDRGDDTECKSDNTEDLHTLSEATEEREVSLRPLIVYRHQRASQASEREMLGSPQGLRQLSAALQFASEAKTTLGPPLYVRRTNAAYYPGRDPALLNIVCNAKRDLEVLVMDDVLRLIDCRDLERARRGLEQLLHLKVAIFSASHGCLLHRLSPPLLRAHIGDRVRMASLKSQRIKEGLARNIELRDPPSRRVIERAAAAKKRKADARATERLDEIEKVRAAMPGNVRSNLKAIATALNAAGVPTASGGGSWQGNMVKRVFDRVGRTLDD